MNGDGPFEVDAAEARRRQEAGALVVDVREVSEWVGGHVPDARHIPLGQLRSRLGELPRDREVLFVCRSGNRSATATQLARGAGIRRAANIRDGMLGWLYAGLPLAREV